MKGRLELGGKPGPTHRLACPGDISLWYVFPVGEADPVCHRTPQPCHKGDCGEPFPVSRARAGRRVSLSRWDHGPGVWGDSLPSSTWAPG